MMIKMDRNIFYIQEGQSVSNEIKDLFKLEGKDFTGKDNTICNFTGFVISGNNVLISWPKNYYDTQSFEVDLYEDSKLLFDILIKYSHITEQKYLNDNDLENFQDTFPLKSFQRILNYFIKYGLYKEETIIETEGYNGKINWKKTISETNKLISNKNLLFIPFKLRKKSRENVFITECMAFVINETFDFLSFMFPYKIRVDIEYNRDLFLNKDYVLKKLKSLKGKIFKDINKRLLRNLITFFERGNPGEFKYKNHYFHSIWEEMIEEYLNRNLLSINFNGHKIKQDCNKFEFKKRRFNIGNREIEVDHYYENNSEIYILDSKYYHAIGELNYKQVAYDYFLRKDNKILINALIAPSNKDYVKNHFIYEKDTLYISEHYFKIKEIMKDCANN
jgi:hypothetical protein